ncbi:signal peptidase I [Phycicoccus sp.]|uniref:signal peptidase I n=1 Tax=Phycicoccus sp. TaxID=1902410 RepID=UPI002B6DDE80|nr:signal peptidase I [Phycicoccus sp.]HMM95832.1 signal peptidase I [Phycicoccus sp.]
MAWLTRIDSISMSPTLRDGRLVPTRRLRRTTPVRRGDLVVVASSEVGRHVVKRVIGLPGEHLALRLGQVLVDGRPLAEPYATPSVFTAEYDVPEGHYFLLGDNRDASSDSRSWRRPFVPRHELVGHVVPAWAWGRRTSTVRTPAAPVSQVTSMPPSLFPTVGGRAKVGG